jgi:hypothetical protein
VQRERGPRGTREAGDHPRCRRKRHGAE